MVCWGLFFWGVVGCVGLLGCVVCCVGCVWVGAALGFPPPLEVWSTLHSVVPFRCAPDPALQPVVSRIGVGSPSDGRASRWLVGRSCCFVV